MNKLSLNSFVSASHSWSIAFPLHCVPCLLMLKCPGGVLSRQGQAAVRCGLHISPPGHRRSLAEWVVLPGEFPGMSWPVCWAQRSESLEGEHCSLSCGILSRMRAPVIAGEPPHFLAQGRTSCLRTPKTAKAFLRPVFIFGAATDSFSSCSLQKVRLGLGTALAERPSGLWVL